MINTSINNIYKPTVHTVASRQHNFKYIKYVLEMLYYFVSC